MKPYNETIANVHMCIIDSNSPVSQNHGAHLVNVVINSGCWCATSDRLRRCPPPFELHNAFI